MVFRRSAARKCADARYLRSAGRTPTLQNTTALSAQLQQISNPASTSYQQYLSTSQFGANFGHSQADYAVVVSWAQAKGLTILATSPSRNSVVPSEPVSVMEEAFQVT
jgi:subtilase family serine protease